MKVKETLAQYKTSRKYFTYYDYLELPEDGKHYEVINGELIMVAAPYSIHQKVSIKIEYELLNFNERMKKGELFHAPIDVVLSETNVVQPDILFITNENSGIITEKNISGAPDLIVEILSPSTAYYDIVEKKEIYEKYGVREYWIVDPKKRWVEIYINIENKFKLNQRLEQEGILKSYILEGFQINMEKIFYLL